MGATGRAYALFQYFRVMQDETHYIKALLTEIRRLELQPNGTSVENICKGLHWSETLVNSLGYKLVIEGYLVSLEAPSRDGDDNLNRIYSTTEPGREYLATL